MEKYREIKWNKEIEIERQKQKNAGKEQNTINSQKNPIKTDYNNLKNKDESVKEGTVTFKSICRLVILIALGTMLGNFISYLGYKYLIEINYNSQINSLSKLNESQNKQIKQHM